GDGLPLLTPPGPPVGVSQRAGLGEATGQGVGGREWVAEREREERCTRPPPHDIGAIETSAGAQAAAAEPVVHGVLLSHTLGVGVLVHGVLLAFAVAYMSYRGVYPTPNILLIMA